jgi:penicillin-insensitive murein endopeptidase
LPTSLTRSFGDDIEFDTNACHEGLSIGFTVMAEHLYPVHLAARARGVGTALVILDPPFLPRLFAVPRGRYLKQNLPFMKGRGHAQGALMRRAPDARSLVDARGIRAPA